MDILIASGSLANTNEKPESDKEGDEEESNSSEQPHDTHLSFHRIGKDYNVSPNAEILDFSNARLKKLEGLTSCTKLKSLSLVSNFIFKIENISHLTNLNTLEFYQNKICKIEGIQTLTNLKTLDLSFNKIRKIENLDSLVNLERLYLSNNKLEKIEGLSKLVNLKLLELGSNRIRTIQEISALVNLEELWIGKNKITSMHLSSFPHLKVLSLQSNRLVEWDEAFCYNCPSLMELYTNSNSLGDPPASIANLKFLSVLDVSNNRVTSLQSVGALPQLEELWMNDNLIESRTELWHLASLKNLRTVYLERNPLQINLGPSYRQAIIDVVPWITQLDARILDTKAIPETTEAAAGLASSMK